MSGRNIKILRKGARMFNAPYGKVKRAFKSLDKQERLKFLEEARGIQYV